jgi:hypothetical protein
VQEIQGHHLIFFMALAYVHRQRLTACHSYFAPHVSVRPAPMPCIQPHSQAQSVQCSAPAVHIYMLALRPPAAFRYYGTISTLIASLSLMQYLHCASIAPVGRFPRCPSRWHSRAPSVVPPPSAFYGERLCFSDSRFSSRHHFF